MCVCARAYVRVDKFGEASRSGESAHSRQGNHSWPEYRCATVDDHVIPHNSSLVIIPNETQINIRKTKQTEHQYLNGMSYSGWSQCSNCIKMDKCVYFSSLLVGPLILFVIIIKMNFDIIFDYFYANKSIKIVFTPKWLYILINSKSLYTFYIIQNNMNDSILCMIIMYNVSMVI